MVLPKPFFQVVRRGDDVLIQVNAMEISTIQPTPAGKALIVLHNSERIETTTSVQEVELAVSNALAKD